MDDNLQLLAKNSYVLPETMSSWWTSLKDSGNGSAPGVRPSECLAASACGSALRMHACHAAAPCACMRSMPLHLAPVQPSTTAPQQLSMLQAAFYPELQRFLMTPGGGRFVGDLVFDDPATKTSLYTARSSFQWKYLVETTDLVCCIL
jgi:hypothetical protein